MQVIDSMIPVLKGKRACIDCAAAFKVTFHVSPATIYYYDNQPISTFAIVLYHFYAYMDVSNSKDRLLHGQILNDTSVIHSFANSRAGPSAPLPSIAKLRASLPELVPGQRGDLRVSTETQLNTLPLSTVSDNSKQTGPAEKDLWRKVREIIASYNFDNEEDEPVE